LLRLSLPLLFCSALAGLLSAQTSPSSSNPSLPGTPTSNLAATAEESLGEDYPPVNSFLRRLGLRARAAAARRAAVPPLIRDRIFMTEDSEPKI
jgi:hypothetical protein